MSWLNKRVIQPARARSVTNLTIGNSYQTRRKNIMKRSSFSFSVLQISMFCISLLSLAPNRHEQQCVAAEEGGEKPQKEQLEPTRKELLLLRIERLEKILLEQEGKARRKRNELSNIVDRTGTKDSTELGPAQQSMLKQIGLLREELTKIRLKRVTAEARQPAQERLPNSEATKESSDQKTEKQEKSKSPLRKDKSGEIAGEGAENDVETRKLVQEIKDLRTQLAKSKHKLSQQKKHADDQPLIPEAKLKRKIEKWVIEETQLAKELDQLTQDARKLGRLAIDVEMNRQEKDSLDRTISKLSQEIERSKSELQKIEK